MLACVGVCGGGAVIVAAALCDTEKYLNDAPILLLLLLRNSRRRDIEISPIANRNLPESCCVRHRGRNRRADRSFGPQQPPPRLAKRPPPHPMIVSLSILWGEFFHVIAWFVRVGEGQEDWGGGTLVSRSAVHQVSASVLTLVKSIPG